MISLAFLFFVLIGGTLLGLVLFRLDRPAKVTEPACGSCGYSVQGLPSFTCPECGADLREVGIVTSSTRSPVGPALLVVLWTTILPLPACLISGTLLSVARSSSVQPPALIGWLTLGFWLVVWLVGVWYLIRRVRRRAASE